MYRHFVAQNNFNRSQNWRKINQNTRPFQIWRGSSSHSSQTTTEPKPNITPKQSGHRERTSSMHSRFHSVSHFLSLSLFLTVYPVPTLFHHNITWHFSQCLAWLKWKCPKWCNMYYPREPDTQQRRHKAQTWTIPICEWASSRSKWYKSALRSASPSTTAMKQTESQPPRHILRHW